MPAQIGVLQLVHADLLDMAVQQHEAPVIWISRGGR